MAVVAVVITAKRIQIVIFPDAVAGRKIAKPARRTLTKIKYWKSSFAAP
jgi:hypothetical protein